MNRAADLIAERLYREGVRHVFLVTGGGAMHLNDAFARHGGLTTVFCHHEQACAMAAESYARLTGRMAAVNVTTGPGGINALNGVFGAYVDSIPMVVVSGQVKRETMVSSYDLPLRQLGDQEVDIVAMASRVTKWATVVREPSEADALTKAACTLAREGRPGPVWLDVPIDVQAAPITHVDPSASVTYPWQGGALPLEGPALEEVLGEVLERLFASERPVVLAGAGVRLSGAHERFLRVVDKLGVPVTTGWNAHDAIYDDHPLYVGRPGTVGDRAGNFAVQNADFLLVLGSRLNIRQISYNWRCFARAAFKVMVDIDAAELAKPTLSIDLPVHADLAEVLALLDEKLDYQQKPSHGKYLDWCLERRRRYRVRPASSSHAGAIDPYEALARLFDELDEGEIVVTGDGAACVMTFQVAELKRGQRLYTNSGCASMGYDLPAAIGAAHGAGGRRVVCIAGDGSIMVNLQELQTIVGSRLPIKIFVLANNGYSSIRQTQLAYFPDNVVGCDPASGLSFPDLVAVARAFGIPATRCDAIEALPGALRRALDEPGPAFVELVVDPDRPFEPKLASRVLEDGTMVSSPLEDMAPFLPREELAEHLLVAPVELGR
jgi:acetolactate synthase-1/2/3 large subunit